MKALEVISWLAHRLAMAFACITMGAVLAYLMLSETIIDVAAENELLRQMVLMCGPEDPYEPTFERAY